jgi:RNA polymerase sigma-70 factor (ECF subfamily)
VGNDVEQALLKRAQGGDRQAFARLVSIHREAVYRAAYWVLKDPEDAMDATQEAFLRAYRHMGTFAGRSSFRTWARRIATNVALDRYGRRKRDRERSTELPEGQDIADPRSQAVGADLEREERRRLVREAIDTLPPAQRAAVVLRDVEGLSYEEIASTLQIPKGTVMSRIYYGRAALKEKLAPVLGPRAEAIRGARAGEGA